MILYQEISTMVGRKAVANFGPGDRLDI